MILSAFYIPKDSIEYLFGKEHPGIMINLGGENFYQGDYKSDGFYISSKVNKNYIPDFFNIKISLISAIVGKNGIGKTTLLRAINEQIDKKSIKCLYIFEFNEEKYILNEIQDLNFFTDGFSKNEISNKSFSKLFYSSETDLDLKDAMLLTNSINQEDTLEDIKFQQIRNNIFFLNSPVSKKVTEIYPDFPTYDNLSIRVTKHKKDYFKYLYANANLGNQNRIDVLKTYIKGDINRINDGSLNQLTINNLKKYLGVILNEGLNHFFDEFWNLEEYKELLTPNTIHNQQDFLKNFEITILSYLILNTTFPSTPFQGRFDYKLLIDSNSFEERLNHFLELFITNSASNLTTALKSRFGSIEVNNGVEILSLIKSYKVKIKPNQYKYFNEVEAVELAEVHVKQIIAIYKFYLYLKDVIDNEVFRFDNNSIIYDINIHSIDIFDEFMYQYNTLKKSLNHFPIKVEFFDFEPNKILSTGEKSILKFYSTFYDSIHSKFIKGNVTREQFYLLLLDEPELGYHPLWKKKFINALVKTFPLLFEELSSIELDKQMIEDSSNKHYLQILFTTHDPLTLSDIPSSNIIYLDHEEILTTKILDGETNTRNTFGANIHELLADSFFISDGLIGEFAKEKIDFVIEKLNSKILINDKNKTSNTSYDDEKDQIKQIINLIDEPIIKFRLIEMFNLAFSTKTSLENEIDLLEEKLKMLKSKKND